jgi:predicted nuclease with TOPRIM domain
MLLIIIASASVFLAIMQCYFDHRTEHIKKENKRLKDENKRVVDKHNDLVERFNTLRVNNKEYVDMIIERNDKIIELNAELSKARTRKTVTNIYR